EPDQSPPSWWDDSFRRALVLTVAGAAVLAAMLFGVLQVVGRNQPQVAGASASPSVQASVEPSASETGEPSETASPSPSAPAGIADGWYRVVTTRNLREDPTTSGSLVIELLPDSVVRLSGAPVQADGFDWYETSTGDGFIGWIAAASGDDLFVTQLTTDEAYEACGRVSNRGIRVAGLRIGLIDDSLISVLQMSHNTGSTACVTFVLIEGFANRLVNVSATACGRPVFGALRPTSAGDVPNGQRVTEPLPLSQAFFEEGSGLVAGELYNRWTVLLIGRRNAEPLACASGVIRESPVEGQRQLITAVQGCLTVTQQSATEIWILPENGEPDYPLGIPESNSIDPLTVGQPRLIRIVASSQNFVERLEITDLGPCPA
ncbi:MAG TPA: SH3 domain-containing protein, partial [Candidatus Limnocylindria bacterium]|nr:SH3 domain-containing protein [Candidatus Limnocylindria bacterium]